MHGDFGWAGKGVPCPGGTGGGLGPSLCVGMEILGGLGQQNPLGWVHGGVQGSVPHWLGLVGVIGVSVWKNQSQSCFLGRGTPGRSWQGLQLGLGGPQDIPWARR